MRLFKSEILDQELQDLLHHFLGSSRPAAVGLAVLSLSSLGWFADSLYGTVESHLRWLILNTRPQPGSLWSLLLTLPLLLVLALLVHRARAARSRLDFRVVGCSEPEHVRALVVFLSAPADDDLQHNLSLGGWLDESVTRSQIRGNWRMPAEAVAFHAFARRTALRDVVIVGSCGEGGSQTLAANFVRWLERLWPVAGPNIRLRLLGELIPEAERGVDVSDLESLVQTFDEIYRQLEADGVPRQQVVVDITGGTKLVSAAGVAVALAEGRRFQYVDTHDYAVTVFNPTYQPRPEET